MTRRQRQARNAANHRHMRDRLLATYVDASADLIMCGREWYPTAEGVIARLADDYALGRPAVAGIVAALSPQTKWRSNIESARYVLSGQPELARAHSYRANIAKAVAIRNGRRADQVLGGLKVRAFWANLIGSGEAVTVDVWAARAATAGRVSVPTPYLYPRIAKAYQAAAKLCGEKPRDFQAAIWLATRPAHEHRHDLRALSLV